MSYSKRNETKKTGLAFCRANGTDGATKHHLNIQERHIRKAACRENVTLKRTVRVRNQRVALTTLMELAQGVDILYITSPKRLTRSHELFTNVVSKLRAKGVEVRVTAGKQDVIFNDLLNYMLEERMHWTQRELRQCVRRHK